MASKGPKGGSDQVKHQDPPFRDVGLRISGFSIWSADYIDAIEFHYTDTNTGAQFSAPKYGGGGGHKADITFANDENLIGFDIHAGRWIDSLTFITSTGDRYTFGGSGGSDEPLSLGIDDPTQRIYDVAVGFGSYLNNLTIYYQ